MFILAVSVGRTAVYICISTSLAELIQDMCKRGFELFVFEIKEEVTETGKVSIPDFPLSPA